MPRIVAYTPSGGMPPGNDVSFDRTNAKFECREAILPLGVLRAFSSFSQPNFLSLDSTVIASEKSGSA